MSKNSNNVSNEESVDAFNVLAVSMNKFREEMEYFDGIGTRIASKTRFIMRLVFITLTISSIYLVFMIFQMAGNMSAMTTHLEDMYKNFGTMSQDMNAIALTVDNMGRNISGMSVIARSTAQMDMDVNNIKNSLYGINQSITGIDNDMVRINSDMQEMNGRLYNMSRSVNSMSRDVNELALPMNSGPLSGFWPR